MENVEEIVLYQSGQVLRQSETRIDVALLHDVEMEELVGLDKLSRDIWQKILQFRILSTKDIIALRRSNGAIRRAINHALVVPEGNELRHNVVERLREYHQEWVSLKRAKSRHALFHATNAEIFFALFVVILFASLPIDSYQVPFLAMYLNVSMQIVNNGYYSRSNINLPDVCYGFNYHDAVWNTGLARGAVGYWFASFGAASLTYTGARMYFNYSFKERPIIKLLSGAALLGGVVLSELLPFWVQAGWPESSAITVACSKALKYANDYLSILGSSSFPIEAFTRGIQVIKPLAPVLAEIPPYVIPALGVGAMVGLGFWAAKRRDNLTKSFDEHDPLQELKPL